MIQASYAATSPHYLPLLKEMFTKVTIEKNSEAIPTYYDNNFECLSNGKKMDFKDFLKMHQEIYKTPIQSVNLTQFMFSIKTE